MPAPCADATTARRDGTSAARLATFALFAAAALSSMAYGSVFVLLADLQDRYGFANWGLGVITAASFLASFAAQIGLAHHADRGRSRLLLWLGLGLTGAGLALFGFGSTLIVLVIGRMLQGLGTGLLLPASRRLLVNGRAGAEGRVLGRFEAVQVGGFLAGPPVVDVVADLGGLRLPFYVLAAAMVVVMAPIGFVREPAASTDQLGAPARLPLDLLRNRGILAGLSLAAGLYVTIGSFDSIWSRFLTDLGASRNFIALSLLIFGLPLLLLMPVGGRLVDRLGPQRTGLIALGAAPLLLSAYGLTTSLPLLAAIAFVHASIDSVTTPAGVAAVARAAPPGRAAAAQGLYGATAALTGGLAALAAPVIYGWVGATAMWIIAGTTVGLIAAAGWLLAPRQVAPPINQAPPEQAPPEQTPSVAAG